MVLVRLLAPRRLLGLYYDDYDYDDPEDHGTLTTRMNTTALVTVALPLIYFWLEVVVTAAYYYCYHYDYCRYRYLVMNSDLYHDASMPSTTTVTKTVATTKNNDYHSEHDQPVPVGLLLLMFPV